MKNQYSQILYFTRRERSGILALIALCLLGWTAPEAFSLILRREPVDFSTFEEQAAALEQREHGETAATVAVAGTLFPFDPNRAGAEELARLGLPPRTVRTWLRYRDSGGRFRRVEDLRRLYNLSPADYERLAPYVRIEYDVRPKAQRRVDPAARPILFPFDPQSVTEAELLALGLPARTARTFIRYRERGGVFRDSADLGKVYGMRDEDVRRLAPYARFAPAVRSAPAARPASPAGAAGSPVVIDINEAAAGEWQRLQGIGPVLSARIVRFRDKLGGFATVEQVGETYGLPDSTFSVIQPFLRASPLRRRLAINRLDELVLSDHPYLDRRQARAIVNYRRQHGPFRTEADVAALKALPPELLEKLAPYWSFE